MTSLEHRIPPPLVLLGAAAVMWGAVSLVPQAQLSIPRRQGCGLGCAALGAVIALTGVWAFRQRGTTINPLQPEQASALVATGIYRFTRNPMYLGMWLALLGWALFLSNAAALVGLVLFVVVLNRLQIAPEERILARLFGGEFEAYCSRVPRWL